MVGMEQALNLKQGEWQREMGRRKQGQSRQGWGKMGKTWYQEQGQLLSLHRSPFWTLSHCQSAQYHLLAMSCLLPFWSMELRLLLAPANSNKFPYREDNSGFEDCQQSYTVWPTQMKVGCPLSPHFCGLHYRLTLVSRVNLLDTFLLPKRVQLPG